MRLLHIRPERAVAAIVVAVALAAAVDQAPALLLADRLILAQPSHSLASSDIDAIGQFVPSYALNKAVETMPSGAIYTVLVGNDPPLPTDNSIAAQPIFQFWLLPRRYTPRLAQAQWVIAYHRAVGSIRLRRPIAAETDLGGGATLLELKQ